MRVILQNRHSFMNSIAGDSIQVLKTLEYLKKTGVEAFLDCSNEIDLGSYDLVHLFNIMPVEETYRQYQNARRQGKKVVLSPVFWDPREFLDKNEPLKYFKDWWNRTMPLRREIMDGVSLMLPNSRQEWNSLKSVFQRLPPAEVVPNAADRRFALARPDWFVKKFQTEDFLLSAGRICRRKNQYNLIRAARRLKLTLVLIGPLNDSEYYLECRREAAGQKVHFIDTLNPLELASAYAAARVHALISWYDTPGLVSLEAALAGCTIVSTNRGSAQEYFGELAYYCDPGNLDSIIEAITDAWKAKKDLRLKQRILENYTWEKTAELTHHAYKKALDS